MALNHKTILVIDDDNDVLVLVRKVIEGAGATCLTANSVDTGIRLAQEKAPHLIVTDLSMPEVDGFDFLKKKKVIPRIQNIPTIVLSGCSDKNALGYAMALGAVDYLPKPLNARLIIQKIRKYFLSSGKMNSVKLVEKISAQVQFNGELIGICDESIAVGLVARLTQGQAFQIEASLMMEAGIDKCVMKVSSLAETPNERGYYISRAHFVGIGEQCRNNLNRIIRLWK